MKLVVVSDSHGHWKNLDKVIEANKDADYILHLGDLCADRLNYPELSAIVRGNNDEDWDLPLQIVADYNGLRVLMLHSHTVYGFQRVHELARKAKKEKCNLVLYGHTHCVEDDTIDGIRLLNPGSLMYNRDGHPVGYYEINIEDKDHYTVVFKEI